MKLLSRIFYVRLKTFRQKQRLIKQLHGYRPHVIKTFAREDSFDGGVFQDPYFGRLSAYLEKERDQRTVTLFESVGHYKRTVRASVSVPHVLAQEAFFSPWDLVRAWIQVLAALFAPFPQGLSFRCVDVTQLLKQRYLLDLLSGATTYHLCYQFAFRRMALALQPSVVTMTTENHPWERMAILGIRRARTDIVINGYQHAAMQETLINMYLAPGEDEIAPLPHRLLTVGTITARALQEKGHYQKTPIIASCALRFENTLKFATRDSFAPRPTLLVALSGTPQAGLLIRYILAQAPRMKAWRILLRQHPVYTIAYLENMLGEKFDLKAHDNVELSTCSLSADLDLCGAVLYQSSTVALEALWMGIPSLAFNDGRLLSSDPAASCTAALHRSLSAEDSLPTVLAAIFDVLYNCFPEEAAAAQNYVRQYFTAPTPQTMNLFCGS
jgi:hypothetical protein